MTEAEMIMTEEELIKNEMNKIFNVVKDSIFMKDNHPLPLVEKPFIGLTFIVNKPLYDKDGGEIKPIQMQIDPPDGMILDWSIEALKIAAKENFKAIFLINKTLKEVCITCVEKSGVITKQSAPIKTIGEITFVDEANVVIKTEDINNTVFLPWNTNKQKEFIGKIINSMNNRIN